MKSSYSALGTICLALAGLWYLGGGSHFAFPSTAAAEEMRVSAPVAHENLTVFFIHGPETVANTQIMTLQEAIESGRAIVHETGNVNTLVVENLSPDSELFMQEGDIVRGGQQDRLVACDMLVPPKSGRMAFPCNCVEHGRWTGRGNEAASHFNKSDRFAVGQKLKIANISQQQVEVWNSVEEQKKVISAATKVNVNSAVSPSSLQLALENPAMKEKAAEYESTLKIEGETRESVVGVVFLVNGEVSGVELYGSNALFRKAWPKLLRSAATEALAEKTEKRLPLPPTTRDMDRYLARVGKMEPDATNNPGGHEMAIMRLIGGDSPVGVLGTEGVVVQTAESLPNNPPSARRAGRIIIEGNEVTGERVRNQVNQPEVGTAIGGIPNQPAPNLPASSQSVARIGTALGGTIPAPIQPQSANGPRLNVNRVENASGVVSESRDPSRQNAVIHMSFIKK